MVSMGSPSRFSMAALVLVEPPPLVLVCVGARVIKKGRKTGELLGVADGVVGDASSVSYLELDSAGLSLCL